MLKKLFLNDFVILFVIIVNAGGIFYSGFESAQSYLRLIEWVDVVCTLIFSIEAFVKINTFGRKRYFS